MLFSPHLSNRRLLREDMDLPAMRGAEVVLTEIKAAAIDVVAETAERKGLPVVFVDNDPVEVLPAREGALREACGLLAELAVRRWRQR